MLDDFNECQHVLQGNIPFYIVGRGEDVTPIATKFQQVMGFITNIVDRSVR
jgi:hypothetical protein